MWDINHILIEICFHNSDLFNSFHYNFQITNPKNRICTLSSRTVIYKLLFEYVKIFQIWEEGYKHPTKWDYGTKAGLQRFFHVNLRHEDKEFQKFSPNDHNQYHQKVQGKNLKLYIS